MFMPEVQIVIMSDEIGKIYQSWTVLKELPKKRYPNGKRPSNKRMVLCRCVCGTERIVQLDNVKYGSSRNCGCLRSPNRKRIVPDGDVNKKQTYKAYERAAKERGYDFKLSYDEFIELTQDNCYYCGKEPSNIFNIKYTKGKLKGQSRGGKPFIYNGIDRKINNKGYTIDNCVTCCKNCNRAKMDMDLIEFLDTVTRIVKHCEYFKGK